MNAMRALLLRYGRLLTTVLLVLVPFSAGAKDLDLLARLLIPKYIAQDFAAICGKYDSHFLPEMSGGSAAVAAYARHLKIEVTSGLTQADALRTMVAAADTARAVARERMHALS